MGNLWSYSYELTEPNDTEKIALEKGYGTDLLSIKHKRDQLISEKFHEATIELPEGHHNHLGGKDGKHTEHLGYILAEMQFLQRAYPGLEW
jgi:ring-1,2-phenylacetyl-CoA epoxidase subunit PaaC